MMMHNPIQDPAAIEEFKKLRLKRLAEFEKDPYIGYDDLQSALNDCLATPQAEVLARLFNRENVFISGPAGSGKSYVISRFTQHIDAEHNGNYNVAITASTGIAAQLIGGRTIHSWSGMGINTEPFSRHNISPGEKNAAKRIRETDVLIIDEISMLPAHLFQRLDGLMKFHRRNKKPFGGVQLVVMGDFLQLPPVPSRNPDVDTRFAVRADAWKEANFSYCYMDKIRRANDKRLKYVLEKISKLKVDDKVRDLVKSRSTSANPKLKKMPGKAYTTLFTTNKNVDEYNQSELKKNKNAPTTYELIFDGDERYWEKIIKDHGLPREITFKPGATVILTANLSPTLSNGSIGVIEKTLPDALIVKFNNGEKSVIEARGYSHTKKIAQEDHDEGTTVIAEVPISTVSQLPVKLGYAISVHKSQGQTFDGVVVDLSRCFTPGLGYVALSRVRDLDDLIITGFKDSAYKMDKESAVIMHSVKKRAAAARKELLSDEDKLNMYDVILSEQIARDMMWPAKMDIDSDAVPVNFA